MSRRAQLAYSAIFIAVLVVPAALFASGMRPANIENRSATPFPELSASSIIDDEDYVALAAYLTDRLPFRDKAIRAESRVDEAITVSDPVRGDQPRGRDGWFYLAETLVDTCIGSPPDRFVARADRLAESAREADLPFAFLIPPDKVSIYPENLPIEGIAGVLGVSSDAVPDCHRLWDESMAEAAASRPWLIPLADDIRKDKGDPDDPLYYMGDSHWTDAGALNQVQQMVEFLAPELWDPDEIQPTAPDSKKRVDTAGLRGETAAESVPGYAVVRPGVSFDYERAPIGQQENMVDVTRATTTDRPLIPGTTVLVGDSFGRHAIELMAPYFEELIYVPEEYLRTHDHDLTSVIDGPPTALFVEQVQRNLTNGRYDSFLTTAELYLNQEEHTN